MKVDYANHINYDKYDLLELFGDEPIIPTTVHDGVFIYSIQNTNGVRLSLCLSIYEYTCDLGLSIYDTLLFDAELDNVEFLRKEGQALRIHQQSLGVDYLIYFSPSLFIKLEKKSSNN